MSGLLSFMKGLIKPAAKAPISGVLRSSANQTGAVSAMRGAINSYNESLPKEEAKPEAPILATIQAGSEARPSELPGVDIIKQYEKLKLKGYHATDYEKQRGIVTVGWGNQTSTIKVGESIDEATADKMFGETLTEMDSWISDNVTADLTPAQRGAVLSLIYNVGTGAFGQSKALKALNKGDLATFKHEAFSKEAGFVNQDGKVLNGLVKRRQAELERFEEGEMESQIANGSLISLDEGEA